MWHKLKKQIAVEREQLRCLMDVHRPLLEKCAQAAPDAIETWALGAMLHSFYTGIENVFKRIRIELDEGFSKGDRWHRLLLDSMTRPGPDRPLVISESLAEALKDYLEFRHVFRQAYTFQLNWDRMCPLVLKCEDIFKRLENELDAFLKAMEAKHEKSS